MNKVLWFVPMILFVWFVFWFNETFEMFAEWPEVYWWEFPLFFTECIIFSILFMFGIKKAGY